MVVFKSDLAGWIAKAQALLDDLPPGNKGGQVMKAQMDHLRSAYQHLMDADSDVRKALDYVDPVI